MSEPIGQIFWLRPCGYMCEVDSIRTLFLTGPKYRLEKDWTKISLRRPLAQLFSPAFQWQPHRMRSSLAQLRTAANHSFSGWKMYATSLPISFSE